MNFFVFFVLIQIQIESRVITNECKSPDKHYLDSIYSQYLSVFRLYEEKIYQNHQVNLPQYNQESSEETDNYDDSVEDTQCDFNERNR